MDEKKNTENGEYQFIREKIISRRKSRVKKVLLIIVGTLFLAAVFGFVARLVFITSEDAARRLLGLSPTPTATVTPTKTAVTLPAGTEKPSPSPSPVPSPTPSPSAELTTPTPTPSPTGPLDDPIAGLENYYSRLKTIALRAARFTAEVKLVSIETDWFGEPIETYVSESGILIGDNGTDLFVMIPAKSAASSDRIDLTIGGSTAVGVEVFAVNDEYNVAILATPLQGFRALDRANAEYAVFGNSDKVAQGELLICVGAPNGYMGTYDVTMVTNTGLYAYVTDDRIRLGNTNMAENPLTNGIFVNTSGEIVGVVTHDYKDEKNAASTSFVAINSLTDVIASLVNGEGRNYLGVSVMETPENVLARLELDYGLYVTDVAAGSPAEEAGIKKGDILVSIKGNKLRTADTLRAILNSCESGEEIRINLIRSTKSETVTAVLGKTE